MKIDSGSAPRAHRQALGLSQAKLAEPTGMPQHVLSAFELEKALADAVTEVIGRRKRHRTHSFAAIKYDPLRAARHAALF